MPINLSIGSNTIAINSLTDLKNALASNLKLGEEFAEYLLKPISALPATASSTTIRYSNGNQNWNLGAFQFALSAGASGTISVVTSGALLSYTDEFPTDITTSSSAADNTGAVTQVTVPAGAAFIAIELDLAINGGISASYTSGLYGISGSVTPNDTFTVTFYKKCQPSDLLGDALKAAFSDYVLPLHVETLDHLKPGDYLYYNFNANLQVGLGASIGINKLLYAGQYKKDIPHTAGAVAVNATADTTLQAGAQFAFSFDYAGTFEALLWKDAPTACHFHLYRSDVQDTSIGLNLGLTLNAGLTGSAAVITSQLESSVARFLPSDLQAPFQKDVWPKASSEINRYVTEANDKVAGWLQPLNNAKATLNFAIGNTRRKFLLTDYLFDLTASASAAAWGSAIGGKFVDALETPNGGVSLNPGSGLENFYSKKTSVTLNLFGKLTAAWSSSLVSKSSLIYAGNNIFHLVTEQGRQLLSSINSMKKEIDFYFAAEVDLETNAQTLAEVEAHYILQATNNPKFGEFIADFIALSTTGIANTALAKNVSALAAQKNTTQLLHLIFTPSAYGRLKYSAIPKAAGADTANDQHNYEAFARACSDTLPNLPASFKDPQLHNYAQWCNWNIASVNDWPAPAGAFADRSQSGDTTGSQAVEELSQNMPDFPPVLVAYAFEAQTDFMNLCQAMSSLAGDGAEVNLKVWNTFVGNLKAIVTNDLSPAFLNPTVLAVARLCADGKQPSSVVGPAAGLTDQNSISVTMTFA